MTPNDPRRRLEEILRAWREEVDLATARVIKEIRLATARAAEALLRSSDPARSEGSWITPAQYGARRSMSTPAVNALLKRSAIPGARRVDGVWQIPADAEPSTARVYRGTYVLGAEIRRRREALGLTICALAGQAGVSHGVVKNWEHGQSMPYPSRERAVLAALDRLEAIEREEDECPPQPQSPTS